MDTSEASTRCIIVARCLTTTSRQLPAVAKTYRQGAEASLSISKGVIIMFIGEKFWLAVHNEHRGANQ